MTFCAPLGVAMAALFIKSGMLSRQNGICVGAILTAVAYWFLMRAITRKLDAEEP